MKRHAVLVSLLAVILSMMAWKFFAVPASTTEPVKTQDRMQALTQRYREMQTAIEKGQVLNELQYGEFSLLSFVMLNLPAERNGDGTFNRGNIAANPTLGSGPAVWETMKNSTEIYRAQGATPLPWATVNEFPDGVTPLTTAQLQQAFGPTNSPWLHFLATSRMIDGQQIVDANAQVLWYDVRCNQDYFDYVTAGQYPLYNTEGQEAARADANFTFNFPPEAIEFKATWRILGPKDDDKKYWTAYGAYYDAKNTLQYSKIGLTALHITSHLQPNWVWMTFEQVDNPTSTFQYFLGEPGNAIGPNATTNPLSGPINQELQRATTGTKWQNYRVIGWQYNEVREGSQPVLLGNSNMETYFAKTSSCMSCHAMANIGPPENRRLNMWRTDESGIQGRIGDIEFDNIVTSMGLDPKQFKQTDYVWSLREAQSTKAPVEKPKSTRR